ncbi:MAG: YdcF family protein [gamma proteobacterium symbiont of Bathyaustriella thionipta]|nr:YdcF family protein [gamma proteobacterium symbiont of Bathyaustriella thionipta]
MSFAQLAWIKALILPPGLYLGIGLLSLILLLRKHRSGYLLLMMNLLLIYALSIPASRDLLMQTLETTPAFNVQQFHPGEADIIIVLGGGLYRNAPEYGQSTVGIGLLERLRYAAWLSHKTGLPILLTGGSPADMDISEAELARQTLRNEFFVEANILTEEESRNTQENARYSARILASKGYSRALLVTHAWHMPRALLAFRQAAIQVIPAATQYSSRSEGPLWQQYLPTAEAAAQIRQALHELIGQIYYSL